MNLRDHGGRRREHPDMEITPLIDVVFLLLIFFLVTTSFSQASGGKHSESEIPIQLPEAGTGDSSQQAERVVLYVREDGQIDLIGDVELRGESLQDKLDDLHQRRPNMRLLLKGDENASHGRITEVLDELRRSGFKNVNLVARKPSR